VGEESVESEIINGIRTEYEKTYPSVIFTLTNRIESQMERLAELRAENMRIREALYREKISLELQCSLIEIALFAPEPAEVAAGALDSTKPRAVD
jgi:hypothetical protein